MIKDLSHKTFKHHIYTEHYNAALDLVQILRLEKTISMTFNKKPRISKECLVQKRQERSINQLPITTNIQRHSKSIGLRTASRAEIENARYYQEPYILHHLQGSQPTIGTMVRIPQ